MLLLDGVFVDDGDTVRWVKVPAPTTQEVQQLVTDLARTIETWLDTQGYGSDDPCDEDQEDDANGALLAASEQAFTVAKWLGAAYLVYLGIRTWRAPPPRVRLPGRTEADGETAAWRLFSQGFLVATSNPKALIFFAAFLPQFIDPEGSWLLQFAILGGTFGIVEFVYELVLAGTAQRIAPWLGSNGRTFNRLAGATFVGIGGVLTTVSRT